MQRLKTAAHIFLTTLFEFELARKQTVVFQLEQLFLRHFLGIFLRSL